MDLGRGLGHLSYSTLVHPADNWGELWESLTRYLPAVKKRLSPTKPFAVSLRLASNSVSALTAAPSKRRQLKQFFDANDMYLYTANAFPYGSFKRERVKEQVYEPDWRSDDRATYTMQVADILAEIAPSDVNPSIQTAPLGFKPRVTGPDVIQAYTNQVIHVVAHLVELQRKTGRIVTLGIEPEPACFLETTAETIDHFNNHLYADAAVNDLARQTGMSADQARDVLHSQLGTVFDVCHQAVEFEDVVQSMKNLRASGIPILKFQIASALRIPDVTPEKVIALKAFDDSVYLHQTIEKRNGAITHYLDIPDALATYDGESDGREWRTHFHVPVFLDDIGAFKTTRPDIEAALRYHARDPVSEQVEIETYTWDVLPDSFKTGDIVEYVSRELEWVRDSLMAAAD
jgi:hypothetical protein